MQTPALDLLDLVMNVGAHSVLEMNLYKTRNRRRIALLISVPGEFVDFFWFLFRFCGGNPLMPLLMLFFYVCTGLLSYARTLPVMISLVPFFYVCTGVLLCPVTSL